MTYGLASPVAHCSVFLAGIIFWISSTNSVSRLIIYPYNSETTTVWLLVISRCVKWPLILRPTAATKMLAAWSSMCGFSIRNICHCHFKNAADCRNQRHSNYAIWNECGEDCLLVLDVILIYGWSCSLKLHTHAHSLTSVYAVDFSYLFALHGNLNVGNGK